MISDMRFSKPAKTGRFYTILLASCAVFLMPSHSSAESLSEAVSRTLQQHPQVDGATAALRAAQQAEKEQFSAYFPTINATAQAGRIYGDNATSRGLSVTRGAGYFKFGRRVNFRPPDDL